MARINDWNLEQTEFLNCASKSGTDIFCDKDGLEISHSQGSGYCRESFNLFIPADVLVKLLKAAGISYV